MRAQNRLPWTVWCLYALVIGVGIAQGGMWLDEMQVWCLGRDHHSISGLLWTLRNEGHPPLWFILVYALTAVSSAPISMAVLHGLFALATAWIILFRAPWPVWWRIIAVCGYFFLFEYAIIARNYGPGAFFLFAALAAHQARKPWHVMLALMALAMMHYWGLVLAGAWAVVMIAARGTDRAERLRYATVFAVSALALYVALPSAKLPYAPDVHRMPLAQVPDQFGGILGEVFFPLPDLDRPSPWNTGWLLDHAHTVNGIIGFVCLGLSIWCVAGNTRWLLFYVLAAMGVLAFPFVSPHRSLRYYGPVLLALLCALWMAPPAARSIKARIVLALLVLQVPGALAMSWVSWHMPRSMADRCVAWIKGSDYRDLPVIVNPYQMAPAVSGYLGRAVQCPAVGGEVSWYDWTRTRYRLDHDALKQALQCSPDVKALLLSDEEGLEVLSDGHLRITPIGSFTGAQIGSEQDHVYLVEHMEAHP